MKSFFEISMLAFLMLPQGCASLKTISEATADRSELADDLEFDQIDGDGREDGKGYVPYLSALKTPPKRVALASFYVYDAATTNKSAGKVTTSVITEQGAKKIATQFYQRGFETMKKNFAANGMTLLTPAEFLDSDEKRTFYEKFEVETNAASDVTGAVLGFLKGVNAGATEMDAVSGAAEGYETVFLQKSGVSRIRSTPDDKLTTSVGYNLAKGLGVDAVVVVYNVIQSDGHVPMLLETNMYMFGPNPVAFDKEDEGFFGARAGHFYAGIHSGFKNVALTSGIDDANSYAGYENVIDVESKKLGEFMKEKTTNLAH